MKTLQIARYFALFYALLSKARGLYVSREHALRCFTRVLMEPDVVEGSLTNDELRAYQGMFDWQAERLDAGNQLDLFAE